MYEDAPGSAAATSMRWGSMGIASHRGKKQLLSSPARANAYQEEGRERDLCVIAMCTYLYIYYNIDLDPRILDTPGYR